jgi:hypothetical protein
VAVLSEGWIVIPNWKRFQHYSDRNPVWLKLYMSLRNKDEWRQLTLAQRGLLVSIWLEYAAGNTQLRTSDIPSLVLQKLPRNSLRSLSDAGLIRIVASKPLARARVEKEKDLPKKVSKKEPGSKLTGWRFVRGSHGVTYVKDPAGTDQPPAGYA